MNMVAKAVTSLPKDLTYFLDQHTDPYFIKDLNSNFIYANLAIAKLVGLRSPEDLLYKTESEVISRLTENEDAVKEWNYQDKKVGTSKKRLTMLEVHPGAVELPYIVQKLPFYNEYNHCVGVLTYCRNIEKFKTNDFINGRYQGSLLLNKPDDFFTEKECEIIFLKLQGKSSKYIGAVLSLSAHIIDSTLQKLYTKVGVSHFDDFADFCHQKNYHRYLPRRFLECEITISEDSFDADNI